MVFIIHYICEEITHDSSTVRVILNNFKIPKSFKNSKTPSQKDIRDFLGKKSKILKTKTILDF